MEIDTQPTEYSDVILRPLHCRLNAHTRSDGSAMLAHGNFNTLILIQRNEISFVEINFR